MKVTQAVIRRCVHASVPKVGLLDPVDPTSRSMPEDEHAQDRLIVVVGWPMDFEAPKIVCTPSIFTAVSAVPIHEFDIKIFVAASRQEIEVGLEFIQQAGFIFWP